MPYIIELRTISISTIQMALIRDILFERKIQLKKLLEKATSIKAQQEIRNEIYAIEDELLPLLSTGD